MDAHAQEQFERFFDALAERVAEHPAFNAKRDFILNDANEIVPATMVEHMRFMARCHLGNRQFIVEQITIGKSKVSTVFIGHQGCIFETMIFGGKLDGRRYRWTTWAEAEDGHNGICNRILAGDE